MFDRPPTYERLIQLEQDCRETQRVIEIARDHNSDPEFQRQLDARQSELEARMMEVRRLKQIAESA